MDFNEILQAIATIGFPITACLYFMWQSKIQDDRNATQIDKMNDILQQNTKALQELSFYIKNGGDGQ